MLLVNHGVIFGVLGVFYGSSTGITETQSVTYRTLDNSTHQRYLSKLQIAQIRLTLVSQIPEAGGGLSLVFVSSNETTVLDSGCRQHVK